MDILLSFKKKMQFIIDRREFYSFYCRNYQVIVKIVLDLRERNIYIWKARGAKVFKKIYGLDCTEINAYTSLDIFKNGGMKTFFVLVLNIQDEKETIDYISKNGLDAKVIDVYSIICGMMSLNEVRKVYEY